MSDGQRLPQQNIGLPYLVFEKYFLHGYDVILTGSSTSKNLNMCAIFVNECFFNAT